MTEPQSPTLEPEDAAAPSVDSTNGTNPDAEGVDEILTTADAVPDQADMSSDAAVDRADVSSDAPDQADSTPVADADVPAAIPTAEAVMVMSADQLAAAVDEQLAAVVIETAEIVESIEDFEAVEAVQAVQAVEAAEAVESVEADQPAEMVAATDEAVPADAPAAESPPAAPVPLPAPAPTTTVAGLVARQLRAAGVRFAFTVPGESFLALLEAFGEEGIRVVATRHEGAAAFMAEAYGQLTGRPAVVLGTRAVGAANMAIGIHTARQDSTPMVAIVGQVNRRLRGREAFQEVDQVATFGRLAKWATEVSDRHSVAGALDEGMRQLRTGRPGPVFLSLPEDLLDEQVPVPPVQPPRSRTPDLDPAAVRSVLHLLAGARRPAIIAGAGILRARATNDLVQFAEMLEVPVVAAWRRPDAFPNQHRLYLGMSGYGSAATVRPRLLEADAVLVLGSRLNEISSFDYSIPSRGQRWAHVDLEPRMGGHGLSAPSLAVTADVRSFLRSAIERLKGGALEAELVDARRTANDADRDRFDAASTVDAEPWDGPGVHPGRIVASLVENLTPDTIVTTDAGNFGAWAARGYRFRRPATFIGPTSGAMGYGLPAAIAAALARPNRPSIALAGDGGFAMTMAELETAVRERARVVAIVFDNERYGTIRAHQERRGKGATATDLGPIDFAAAARAFGAYGVRVETDAEFEPALREALGRSGPSVLHLVLDRRWLSIDRVLDR